MSVMSVIPDYAPFSTFSLSFIFLAVRSEGNAKERGTWNFTDITDITDITDGADG